MSDPIAFPEPLSVSLPRVYRRAIVKKILIVGAIIVAGELISRALETDDAEETE